MIADYNAKKYCRDDIKLIENYEQAINDKENIWECHHRLEFTLDGEFAHTKEELNRLGMYWKRPYFELIFLKEKDHHNLHQIQRTKAHIGKSKSEFGELMIEKYGATGHSKIDRKLYDREYYWYKKTGKLR